MRGSGRSKATGSPTEREPTMFHPGPLIPGNSSFTRSSSSPAQTAEGWLSFSVR